MKNDVERGVVVVQVRFRVVRLERFYFRKDDIIEMSECCIILHRRIVRMSQNGLLGTADGMEDLEIVTEFLDEETRDF